MRRREGATRGVGERSPERPGREGAAALGHGALCTRSAAVDALVAQHVLAAPEALAALPAGEWPRPRVRLAVANQVLTPVEGLAAVAAGVRPLARGRVAPRRPYRSRVRAAVAPQVLLAPEGLAALGAGVWLLPYGPLRTCRSLAALRAGGPRGARVGGWGAIGLLLGRPRGPGISHRRHLHSGAHNSEGDSPEIFLSDTQPSTSCGILRCPHDCRPIWGGRGSLAHPELLQQGHSFVPTAGPPAAHPGAGTSREGAQEALKHQQLQHLLLGAHLRPKPGAAQRTQQPQCLSGPRCCAQLEVAEAVPGGVWAW